MFSALQFLATTARLCFSYIHCVAPYLAHSYPNVFFSNVDYHHFNLFICSCFHVLSSCLLLFSGFLFRIQGWSHHFVNLNVLLNFRFCVLLIMSETDCMFGSSSGVDSLGMRIPIKDVSSFVPQCPDSDKRDWIFPFIRWIFCELKKQKKTLHYRF